MLRWLEDYFARRATIRQLGAYVSPEARDEILSGNYHAPEPKRRDIDFMLILVGGETPEIRAQNIGNVANIAMQNQWVIDSYMANLLLILDGRFLKQTPTPPITLATSIHEQLGENARIVYGRESALVGSTIPYGGSFYTALWEHFPDAIEQLCALPVGESEEFKLE